MTQIIGTTPETIQALIAERDHWKRLAHDRVVSTNALLDRARKAEALSNLFSEHLERRTLTLELTKAPATPELVERLRDPDFKGSFQHLRPWTEIDALFEQAADALEAQQARIAELEGLLGLHAAMQSEVERAQAAEEASQALADRYEKALRELVALVRGECPRLLDEDSGGNAALSIEIDEALSSSQGRTIERLATESEHENRH